MVAAGMPFAHAMPTPAASAPVHEVHHHVAADHAIHDQAQHAADTAVQHDHDGSAVADWLNGKSCCSMCATAYVAPSLGHAGVARVSFAVRYWVLTAFRPDTLIVIDPGIPIV